MKRKFYKKLLAGATALTMSFTMLCSTVSAESKGKYVQDVFIAYGEKKEDAEKWLRDNGWEPVCDLNDGKTSDVFTDAVAVMGIQRTDDPNEAVTDMATMNMLGGYSFDDYEGLVKQKKADIDEFINTFVPALNEYRDNYNGKGSEGGKKRAQMAHDILNKFYDGDPDSKYAVNDTGKRLGDLLLNKTKTEIGDEAYKALPKSDKKNTADLQQIILESSGPAVLAIEQTLALATDTAEDTWLDRLDGLTGDDLVDRIAEFAPEAEGQDLAPSAALTQLAAHFEDYSKILADQWLSVHQDILWYEEYCEAHELRPGDDAEALNARLEEHFNKLKEEDYDRYEEEFNRFFRIDTYYYSIQEIDYPGEWGETLFEFFRPEDEDADYSEEIDYFAPLAAALSNGQRAALGYISLTTLLKLGIDSDSVMEAEFPKVSDIFKSEDGKELESISVYSGINRAIFRKGVALTSKALSEKAIGRDPYGDIWDPGGVVDILSYTSFGVGMLSMAAGAAMAVKAAKEISSLTKIAEELSNLKSNLKLDTLLFKVDIAQKHLNSVRLGGDKEVISVAEKVLFDSQDEYLLELNKTYAQHAKDVAENKNAITSMNNVSTAGKWLMGIGGALMIAAAVLKAVEMHKYYNRDFTVIPNMIVDEADIVTHTTDANGQKVDIINFDQFAYYEVVKCNRQEIGIHTDAMNGVSDYASWGCGDAADINADVGLQWLALYINRSPAKGNPILADSFTLKTGEGSEKTPEGYACLHMFNAKNAVKIDHRDYSYRSDNKGMYLYWKSDASAFTASAFNKGGTIAISAIGGLIAGIAGTTLFMLPKKKKEEAAGA